MCGESRKHWCGVGENQEIISNDYLSLYGITSTVMLYSYLESKGANVFYYIPSREKDGYGINKKKIEEFSEEGVKLIITVDNGISAIDESYYANELGIDMVITDHHREHEVLPKAVAIVDPHRSECNSKFKDFSGVGVVFKLIEAMEGENFNLKEMLDKYSDILAIGTVGDVVPLRGENRTFVKEGLKRISNPGNPGIRSLLKMSGIYGKDITSVQLAFIIVPRLNVAGRLNDATKSAKLLLSQDDEEAELITNYLEGENIKRKNIEYDIMMDINKFLINNPERQLDRILVLDGEKWHEGVIGIIASKVMTKYGKPCIIISKEGENAKGSGRSMEGLSLHEAISYCSEYLLRFGGHYKAAGVNLLSKDIERFRTDINKFAMSNGIEVIPELEIDKIIDISSLSMELVNEIKLIEPFGEENSKPVFGLLNLEIVEICPVGSGNHLKLTLSDGSNEIRMMKFNTSLENFYFNQGDLVDVAVTLDKSIYRDREYLSIVIEDMKLANMDNEYLILERHAYEHFMNNEYVDKDILISLRPSREEFALVYRYLRESTNGNNIDINLLYTRFKGSNEIGFGKFLIIINVFKELELIDLTMDSDIFKINLKNVKKKVDLHVSNIIRLLDEKIENNT